MTIYPNQDTFVRGEVSPRLHARATLDLYKGALARCQNFLTLPHGGIRKRGGTYFSGETKNSAKRTRLLPFIFSSEQAYAIELGDQYLRVYAYGARVGTVEVATPWLEADLPLVQFYQSNDQMWLTHPSYTTRLLTRVGHTNWTLTEYLFKDGPYQPINTTTTVLTPAESGAVHPMMTGSSAPSGTVSASSNSASAWVVFDRDIQVNWSAGGAAPGNVAYDFAGSTTKVCDAYWIISDDVDNINAPISWTFQGFDGSNWITLDTRLGESNWKTNERRFYELTNKAAYLAYRLSVDATEQGTNIRIGEMGWHESGDTMTPFNLTASSTAGINGGQGFLASDIGRTIRLLGSDNVWRWARITGRSSTTVVQIRLYGHALPDLNSIVTWRMDVFEAGKYASSIRVNEERLTIAQRFSVHASRSFSFDEMTPGEKDDDALSFRNAGGGQANDIVWLADADGFLLVATTSGVRALSGAGIDEALTPTSFKNRKSRGKGSARISPVDAGESFLYVTASRRSIAELTQTNVGRFASEDIGQVSEHIPKKGIVELAYQADPDPLLWFPLDNGELGGFTHQPSQEVRGMHRHRFGGLFSGADWAIVESVAVTPGQDGIDDVWLIVKRTIGGATKRYIEIMEAPFEYGAIVDAFCVDCGLIYQGAPVTSVTGMSHLAGETVDVLADGRVYKGLVVSGGGGVSLPVGAAAASKWIVGLPLISEGDTLELDVGGKDGSLMGRRKRITKVILSLLETDLSGLQISSLIKGRWEPVKLQTIAAPSGVASLFSGNVEVPIDDSWEGQGRVTIRHVNPTPCTIRAMTPAFDSEP